MNSRYKQIITLPLKTIHFSGKARNRWSIIVSGTLTILLFGMNTALSQPVVEVKGSSHARAVKRQVHAYLDHLDVQESPHLTVRFSHRMPSKLNGITISLPSPKPDAYQVLKVLIDARLTASKQRLVLAHEMIHVKQYAKGELVSIDKNQVMWQGRKRYYARAYNRVTPWEKEAYRGDRALAQRIESSSNVTRETLLAQVSGHVSEAFARQCSSDQLEKCAVKPK